MAFTFDDILPYLASAYRRGVLVPFIGSGMSRPACTGWLDFLLKLAAESGVDVPTHLKTAGPKDTSELYRLADKAVLGLASLDAAARAEAYRKALNEGDKLAGTCVVPAQTEALARCYWPLVLTTNYDDLYIASRTNQSHPSDLTGGARTGSAAPDARKDETDVPEVLGRSIEDCHKVLRALDAPLRPILWALQGFVGGQAAEPAALIPDERRRLELAGQVVAGHQQYQHAVNAQPHFRRAFAEVFSRRSLLFLGSGLLEDYLINLFGEIAHHSGPGPHPHFALFSRDREATLDQQFLQTRLGIAPVFYENHSELKELLDRLTEAVWKPRAARASGASGPMAWMPDELGFSLTDGFHMPAGKAPRLRLRYAPLSVPDEKRGECVIVSVGRTRDNQPLPGSQAGDLLEAARQAGLIADAKASAWVPLGAVPSYAYRFGSAPLFAVAARLPKPTPPPVASADDPEDERDLAIIADAVREALRAASNAGFRHVRIGPVASGQFRLWNPLHPFVQTLAGIRQFFASTPGTSLESVDLHVFSPAVWFPVVAGKVPVAELLSSRMMKIWVDVRDPSGASEIFAVTTDGPTRVGDIKKLCGLVPSRWETEILPRPSKVAASDKDDLLVTPTSIVVFSPRAPGGIS